MVRLMKLLVKGLFNLTVLIKTVVFFAEKIVSEFFPHIFFGEECLDIIYLKIEHFVS